MKIQKKEKSKLDFRIFLFSALIVFPITFLTIIFNRSTGQRVDSKFQEPIDATPIVSPTPLPMRSQVEPMGAIGDFQPTPQPGCNNEPFYETCAFYVPDLTWDAGNYPEANSCHFSAYDDNIYFGNNTDNYSPWCLNSGFVFPQFSLPTDKEIFTSYIEFTVDGPYSDKITAYIYGEASLQPESYEFPPYGQEPISARSKLDPMVTWIVPSANTTHNLGDQWELDYTRRTPRLNLDTQFHKSSRRMATRK